MSKISRRAMFPLAGAGIIAAADGSQGAAIDHGGQPGILVRMAQIHGKWSVLVPDLEAMHGYWKPGWVIPVKWMPVDEYLKMLDETYTMDG